MREARRTEAPSDLAHAATLEKLRLEQAETPNPRRQPLKAEVLARLELGIREQSNRRRVTRETRTRRRVPSERAAGDRS